MNLGTTINSSSDDANPGLSPDGHWLFFASPRPGGFGAVRHLPVVRGRTSTTTSAGRRRRTSVPSVNSAGERERDERLLRERRPPAALLRQRPTGGPGGGSDIYMSKLRPDGTWGPPAREPSSAARAREPAEPPSRRARDLLLLGPSGRKRRDRSLGVDAGHDRRALVDAGQPRRAGEHRERRATRTVGRRAGRSSSTPTAPAALGGSDLWMTTRAAKLTVTANDQSRLFGQANPPLTYTISGFVGGETSAVVSGTAACSTTATPSSPAGDYPITCTAGSLSAPGYVFESFVAGTLTVSYSRPCLTGTQTGPLNVAAGEAVCIGAGGIQTGPVTVSPGGSLDVEGGRSRGRVTANGAAVVRICGATITGPLTISGSTGRCSSAAPAATRTRSSGRCA